MVEQNLDDNNRSSEEISRLRQAVLDRLKQEEDLAKKPELTVPRHESLARPTEEPPTQKKIDKKDESALKPEKVLVSHQTPVLKSKIILPTATAKLPKKKLKEKIVFSKIIIWLVITLLALIIILGIAIYQFDFQNSLATKIAKIIPYPVVIVNFKPLFYYDWGSQIETLTNFYLNEKNSNPDLPLPTLTETKKHILNRMIEKELLNQIAKKYSIAVTTDELKKHTASLADEIGGMEILENQIKQLYNWDISDFQKEILEPLILKNKLKTAITLDDRINLKARQKAEEVLAEIKKGTKDFGQLAEIYSEDVTATQGGDLGYFSRGQMVPKFEQAAFELEVGETSGLVRTSFGYHIIKLEEKLTDEQGKTTQVRARHILIRVQDLESYLEEFKSNSKIWQLVKIK